MQRILSASPEIATTPESWLLVPLFNIDQDQGVFARYGHVSAANAIREFSAALPAGRHSLLEALRDTYLNIVGQVADEPAKYFLEKTPRNTLVLGDLMDVFQESRFIFLWRHPLGILNSIAQGFGGGEWKVYKNRIDLYEGLDGMVRAYKQHEDRILSINYEHFVQCPEENLVRLSNFLSIDLPPGLLTGFKSNQLPGRMGDPLRGKKYDDLSKDSHDLWRSDLNTPVRRLAARRYLRWIIDNNIAPPGYDLSEELGWGSLSHNYWSWIKDAFYTIYGHVDSVLEVNQFRRYFARTDKNSMLRRHF
ncbi:MAG: sulfotransferase [Gammaproteobacteria bacterium]|nr:sulfotransferase [Gammaproteobacteria bacterium]NNL52048.1 sulfotransferase [Woeseiaceae bacterium]